MSQELNQNEGITQPKAPSSPMIELSLDAGPASIPGGFPASNPNMPTIQEVSKVDEVVAQPLDDRSLTVAEKEAVQKFATQIDITNANQILQYGAKAQRNISSFSETALSQVQTKDSGEVGEMLSKLVIELKNFSIEGEQPKGFAGLFKKASNKFEGMKIQYATAEKNVDSVAMVLQNHQIQLMKDIAVLDQMYDMNLSYYKELTMYILAGKKALDEAQGHLVTMQAKAKASGLPEEAQAANDFANQINRFEKKIHDLELTRIISIQMAPQIRLVQNNDVMMVEKIQTSLVNTIPLWKNQMVLALGIANSKQALESQRAVTDMTNELLRKNADTLKMGTIETAKESERAIVDIETLKHTNEQLISTLDQVVQIQEEGRQKRRQAENEMANIEGQLKAKLLELKTEQTPGYQPANQ